MRSFMTSKAGFVQTDSIEYFPNKLRLKVSGTEFESCFRSSRFKMEHSILIVLEELQPLQFILSKLIDFPTSAPWIQDPA